MAHAFFHPGTSIIAVAVHTDRDPVAVAAAHGVDVTGFDRRGSVQCSGAPSSPRVMTEAARIDAELVAERTLPDPNEFWATNKRRRIEAERKRRTEAARASVAPFEGPEPEWVRTF